MATPRRFLPRLLEITPHEFAEAAHALVREHVLSLVETLGEYLEPVHSVDVEASPLFPWERLASWAKGGEDGVPGSPSTYSNPAALVIIPKHYALLYSSAVISEPAGEEQGYDTILAVVMSAAFGRAHLVRGESIPINQLAALGSMAPSRVRQLVQAGELLRRDRKRGASSRRMDAPIVRADAIRWLISRDVRGFAEEKKGKDAPRDLSPGAI